MPLLSVSVFFQFSTVVFSLPWEFYMITYLVMQICYVNKLYYVCNLVDNSTLFCSQQDSRWQLFI